MTPKDLAELAYWHLSLGDDEWAWRKFWSHLYDLTGAEMAGQPEYVRA